MNWDNHVRTVTGTLLSASGVSGAAIHYFTHDNISLWIAGASLVVGVGMLYLSYRKHIRDEREYEIKARESNANISKIEAERDKFRAEIYKIKGHVR